MVPHFKSPTTKGNCYVILATESTRKLHTKEKLFVASMTVEIKYKMLRGAGYLRFEVTSLCVNSLLPSVSTNLPSSAVTRQRCLAIICAYKAIAIDYAYIFASPIESVFARAASTPPPPRY